MLMHRSAYRILWPVIGLSLCLSLVACTQSSDVVVGPPGGGPVDPPPPPAPDTDSGEPRTRYEFNNRCVLLQSVANNQFVAVSGSGYSANTTSPSAAEAFFFKPSALGDYLLFTRDGSLLSANAPVTRNALSAATNANIITVKVKNDTTVYIQPPLRDREPTAQEIQAYRTFNDPALKGTIFTLTAAATGQRLQVASDGTLSQASAAATNAQEFRLVTASQGCASFPEANNNAEGETFKGTTADGRVLGMVDAHVHLSSTTFLGNAQYGDPFHRFGVTHALADCAVDHGQNGMLDLIGSLFVGDMDGHKTDGWPTFTDWPSRSSLTHEAMYWKWLERAWMGGLRIMVNDVVENETLCELQRNVTKNPLMDCNEMNSAARQVGTLYAMQDYIDAQYGGRNKGWFRIVLTPAEARQVIADGKLALVIGIEISNLFDCKVQYNPLRQQEPWQETGSGPTENRYTCTEDSMKQQLARLLGLGVRQVITIHEFDNAFGGNGIFDGAILNLGNRENSGGIPSGDLNIITTALSAGNPSQISPLGYLQSAERPTGEFWTTYDCPEEGVDKHVDGTPFDYLWGGSGGANMTSVSTLMLPSEICPFLGQGGRPGGVLLCYPEERQCNARWMTPFGLTTYKELMKAGMIFDIDHLELEMKTQALELAEAQTPAYPFVSTHGTFGGTSKEQALRILRNKGFIYPSLGNAPSLLQDKLEVKALWQKLPEPRPIFGFGFGTDTNGLSAQASPRGNIPENKRVEYPFALFEGAPFNSDAWKGIALNKVTFQQPCEGGDCEKEQGIKKWSLDIDGSAHYGMLSDFVEELRKEGTAEDMQDVFNAAERYLQTWEATLASQQGIKTAGIQVPITILRPAPKPASSLPIPFALPSP